MGVCAAIRRLGLGITWITRKVRQRIMVPLHCEGRVDGVRRGFLREGVMAYSANRLPSRFPVGTKFVIEGRRGVYSRHLEFPDGTCVRLPKRGKRTTNRRSRRRR